MVIGLLLLVAIVFLMQWSTLKGSPKRVSARIVSFDSHYSRGLLRYVNYLYVRMNDGRTVIVYTDSSMFQCKIGDVVAVNEYENGYSMDEETCSSVK